MSVKNNLLELSGGDEIAGCIVEFAFALKNGYTGGQWSATYAVSCGEWSELSLSDLEGAVREIHLAYEANPHMGRENPEDSTDGEFYPEADELDSALHDVEKWIEQFSNIEGE